MKRAGQQVVICIGNAWRRDDGVGLAVAAALRDRVPAEAQVVEQSGEVDALLDALDDADTAIIVDSMSSGAEPGSVRRLDPALDDLADALPRTSSHALGLADALELARTLGQLPRRAVVFGIEGESFEMGDGLSSQVARAVAEVAERVVAELAERNGDSHQEDPCTSRR